MTVRTTSRRVGPDLTLRNTRPRLSTMESERRTGSEDRQGARDALASIDADRRRIWEAPPPAWLFEGLGLCMLIAAIVVLLLTGAAQSVLLALDLIALFCIVFAAPRQTGVVPSLTHLPARSRSPRSWIAFIVIMVPFLALNHAAARMGLQWLLFLLLAVLIARIGTRLRRRFR